MKPNFPFGCRLMLPVAVIAALLCVLVRCKKQDDAPNARHVTVNPTTPALKLPPHSYHTYKVTATSKMMLKFFPPYIQADGYSVDTLGEPDSLQFTCILLTADNLNNWLNGVNVPALQGTYHTYGYKSTNLINYTFQDAGDYYVVYKNDTTVTNYIADPLVQQTWFYYGNDSMP